jgi:hypothetical protein
MIDSPATITELSFVGAVILTTQEISAPTGGIATVQDRRSKRDERITV